MVTKQKQTKQNKKNQVKNKKNINLVALMHRVLFWGGFIFFFFCLAFFCFLNNEKTPASGASQGNRRFKPIWPKRHS